MNLNIALLNFVPDHYAENARMQVRILIIIFTFIVRIYALFLKWHVITTGIN